MNSVHDMGGMQGFGPVHTEKNEPVFHARWEGRITAIFSLLGAWRKWNGDVGRQTREYLAPATYLALNYHQLRYVQVVELLVGNGMATREEIKHGRPAKGAQRAVPPLTGGNVAAWFVRGNLKKRDVKVAPKFLPGQRVRVRNLNPPTPTRLPRYARGKLGLIERDHGVFPFPDSNAQGLGEQPQHVYSVRFAAGELWGDHAKPKDTVIVAMWGDYLEPL